MAGLGFVITLLDLLMRTSRLQDLLLPGLHLPLIVMALGAVALVLSGRLFQAAFSKIGRVLALLTVLMFLSVGVSVWPGGAYQYMLDNWVAILPMFFLLCGFLRTFKQLKTSMLVAACGYAAISYAGMAVSHDDGVGRAGISSFTFGNSNDLAMVTLFGVPFAVWLTLDKRTNLFIRLFLAGGLLCTIPLFFRAGSRAGLIALAGVGLYVIFRLSFAARIRIALVAALVLPLGFAVVPARVLDRYATILTAFLQPPDPIADPVREGEHRPDEVAVGAATASTNSRLELLKRSIVVTFQNPFLGVGPGMFVVAENELAVADGRRRGYWKASHNMYTQMSSEAGIPALALYLYLMVLVWRILSKAEKADPREISFAPDLRKMAMTLKCAMVIVAVFGLTLSMAYGPFLPMMCAWCIVIERLSAAAWQSRSAASAAVTKDAVQKLDPRFARPALPAVRG